MKTLLLYIFTVVMFLLSCNKEKPAPVIQMTTNRTVIGFYLRGSGTATIDWGDGSPLLTKELTTMSSGSDILNHEYNIANTRTIEIFGDNITEFYSNMGKLLSLDTRKCSTLEILNCSENVLRSLDVSKNTKLTTLICSDNLLTSLDVSKNLALNFLYCSNNQFTILNVSHNKVLGWLYLQGNQLKSLDVSKNLALIYLDCGYNKLTSLDVSKNTSLKELGCHYNDLAGLDLSKNSELTNLGCYKNQLTGLDVSNNSKLVTLWCQSNQLSADALDILFTTLNDRLDSKLGKTILIGGNPGTSGCNPNIATEKGWTVIEN